MIPFSLPILSMMSSINPRAFIRAPMARDVAFDSPAHLAAPQHATPLPTVEIKRTISVIVRAETPVKRSSRVLRPENVKNNGNKRHTVSGSTCARTFSLVTPLGIAQPRMNAPKTAYTPILSVMNELSMTSARIDTSTEAGNGLEAFSWPCHRFSSQASAGRTNPNATAA